jgi:hypothetical protein
MSVHEEGDSILLRTLGNDLRDCAVSYTRRPRCKIFGCMKYSSNYRYHQINIRNVCILPTESVLCFPCDLQKTAIISRFQIVRTFVMKMQDLRAVTLCPCVSVAGITKELSALKRRETLTQRHGVTFRRYECSPSVSIKVVNKLTFVTHKYCAFCKAGRPYIMMHIRCRSFKAF